MTIDVYNIIRQLTDQEDPISGQMKRECFDSLLPISNYYKGWNFRQAETRFNFLPNEDYHKDGYEVKINVNDDVERIEKIEALNEDIDEYNDWVNEKNQLHSDELLEKAIPDGKMHDVKDLNLDSKRYFILGKHKPWLCTFIIEKPQLRKIDNFIEFGYCDDKVVYKLMQEMEIGEFVKRFNATLYDYITGAVDWLKKNNAFDKEALWYEPNREFANWFASKNLRPMINIHSSNYVRNNELIPKGMIAVEPFDHTIGLTVKDTSEQKTFKTDVEKLLDLASKGVDPSEHLYKMMDDSPPFRSQPELTEELKEIFEIRDITGLTHMQIEMEMREIFEEHKGKGYFVGVGGFEQLQVCYAWGCKFWTANGSRLTVKQMKKGATRYPK